MAVSLYPQVFSKFLGIREFNGVNSDGCLSAIKADNVELFQTDIGAGTGVKSSYGNAILYELPKGYEIIDIFSSVQDNVVYDLIYAENEEKGTLFYINISSEVTPIIDDLPLSGQSNGITMTSSAYDVFVFTNGKNNTRFVLLKVKK